jgi:hypothetical protein
MLQLLVLVFGDEHYQIRRLGWLAIGKRDAMRGENLLLIVQQAVQQGLLMLLCELQQFLILYLKRTDALGEFFRFCAQARQ